MDGDSGSAGSRRLLLVALAVAIGAILSAFPGGPVSPVDASTQALPAQTSFWDAVAEQLPPNMAVLILTLLTLSAFFSGSEVAFFSIHQVRLRGMREEGGLLSRMVANSMKHPQRFLTTILIGNMIVNVLISIVLPPRLERIVETGIHLPPLLSYIVTVSLSTVILVFFGEITPKIFAVRVGEPFARTAAIPLQAIDWILTPARVSAIRFTEFLFRVTRFNEIKPAPFITDEEFISVLSDSEELGVIEEDEGQMIQGIIEFGDAYIREILVPRPDVVAIEQSATIGEARELFRQHTNSRMPVYHNDLDHITGVLVAKDLLQSVGQGDLEKPIGPLSRRPNYVPQTMTIREFVKDAQGKRMHLAVVVDEYGGTEGIVTLEDALEEVVGEIQDPDEPEPSLYSKLGNGTYRVDGSLPLDELSELIGVNLQESEHETVAGYFIDHTNKVPEKGDTMTQEGVVFTVEDVEGKRAAALHIHVLNPSRKEKSA